MYDPYSDFQKSLLPNGLEISSLYWDRPWIVIELIIHAGGREDPIEKPGLAHFVEHMVSENIPDWDFKAVEKFFEDCGGWAEFGSTNYLATRYRFGLPTDRHSFCQALSIFGSMLLEADLNKNIERERKVINQEFLGSYPFKERLIWETEMNQNLFSGHRLETWNRPLGRPEGFLATTEVDLKNFYNQYYVPANMSLVAVGGLKQAELLAEIEKSPFGLFKAGLRNIWHKPFDSLTDPKVRERNIKYSDYASFKVEQSEYKASWALPAKFSFQVYRVYNKILGQMLNEEIRQKRGLAYHLGVNQVNFQDVVMFTINCQFQPEAKPLINKIVRQCIGRVPTRRDIFEPTIKSLIKQCLMIDLSGQGLANSAARDLAARQQIMTTQEIYFDLSQVSPKNIRDLTMLLNSNRQFTFIAEP